MEDKPRSPSWAAPCRPRYAARPPRLSTAYRGWLRGKPISAATGICLSHWLVLTLQDIDPYMAKAIRYTFPDEHAPTELKIIQEAASSIKGFYFSAVQNAAHDADE